MKIRLISYLLVYIVSIAFFYFLLFSLKLIFNWLGISESNLLTLEFTFYGFLFIHLLTFISIIFSIEVKKYFSKKRNSTLNKLSK